MKVRYLRNGEYQGPDMTIGRIYVVVGIEADDYRIIDDTDMPYLYNPEQFEVVDAEKPCFWVTKFGGDGEEYSYPPTWSSPGFFEDFHNGNNKIVAQFWLDYESLYGRYKSI